MGWDGMGWGAMGCDGLGACPAPVWTTSGDRGTLKFRSVLRHHGNNSYASFRSRDMHRQNAKRQNAFMCSIIWMAVPSLSLESASRSTFGR